MAKLIILECGAPVCKDLGASDAVVAAGATVYNGGEVEVYDTATNFVGLAGSLFKWPSPWP